MKLVYKMIFLTMVAILAVNISPVYAEDGGGRAQYDAIFQKKLIELDITDQYGDRQDYTLDRIDGGETDTVRSVNHNVTDNTYSYEPAYGYKTVPGTSESYFVIDYVPEAPPNIGLYWCYTLSSDGLTRKILLQGDLDACYLYAYIKGDGVTVPYTDQFKGKLIITEPAYDDMQFTDRRIQIKYGYGVPCEIPKPGKATITGVSEVSMSHTGTTTKYETATNIQYSFFKAQVNLEPGINTIVVTLNYNGVEYKDTRTVECLNGVVDEDDDGIDDRTGLPVSGDVVEIGDAPEMPGDGATIIDWVEWLFQSIAWLMTSMINAIKTIGESLGDLSAAITKIFAFMPAGLLPLMIFGLTIAIILRILKR